MPTNDSAVDYGQVSEPISAGGLGANKFRELAGRDLTPGELSWANNWQVVSHFGNADTALEYLGKLLNDESNYILSAAKATGIKNFDINQANAMRDQYLGTSGDYGLNKTQEARGFIPAALTSLSTEQAAKETEDKVNAILNPTITDAHRQTATALIQEIYGSAGPADQVDFVARELASGTSPYEVRLALQSTPEYQKKVAAEEKARAVAEATAAREQLNLSLNAQREQAYKKALPNIIGSYMRAGKLSSSGLDSAVSQAQAELVQQQQNYMAGLQYEDAARQAGYSREDFINQQNLGYNNYLASNQAAQAQRSALQGFSNYAQYQSPWDAMTRQFQLADARTARAQELSDYALQQSDFNRYQSQQRKAQREAALYGLAGSAIGGIAQGLAFKSDARLKKEIVPVTSALEKLKRLNGVNFKWINGDGKVDASLIAQDVETVMPEAVQIDERGIKYIKIMPLIALIVEAIKEK